ncbi:MAG: hypothetical protein ACFB2Z_03200 [Maricaulaceae bacterium]
MQRKFAMDQGGWLVHNVEDVQSHGGVCHAMSTNWVLGALQNQAFNVQTEYWRGVSHQRAYALRWDEALRGLWGGVNYGRYLAIAEPPSRDYVQSEATRLGYTFAHNHVGGINQLAAHITGLANDSGIVIVMFGVDPNEPAASQNWGHTVAVRRSNAGVFRFLDVNDGQYVAGGGGAAQFATDVYNALHGHYSGWGIRDVYIYRVDS